MNETIKMNCTADYRWWRSSYGRGMCLCDLSAWPVKEQQLQPTWRYCTNNLGLGKGRATTLWPRLKKTGLRYWILQFLSVLSSSFIYILILHSIDWLLDSSLRKGESVPAEVTVSPVTLVNMKKTFLFHLNTCSHFSLPVSRLCDYWLHPNYLHLCLLGSDWLCVTICVCLWGGFFFFF